MELELKKTSMDSYESGGEVTLSHEETTETIVPDYCPDMARVIHADAEVFPHSRELREGKAEVTGTVRLCVLYAPEGEGGVRSLEFSLPYTLQSDHAALSAGEDLLVQTEIESLECRMLNPRKLFTRCKLVTTLTAYQRTSTQLCADVEAEEALCLEKRQEKQTVVLITHIAEKDFTFSESCTLPREGAAELLSSRVRPAISERKIVGNKLICKGLITLDLLYRTQQGQCCTCSCELPFSQIMEVEGAPEDAEAALMLYLTGKDIALDGDDSEGREVSVTLYLHAVALLRERREVTLLRDLYSTAYETAYEAKPMDLTVSQDTQIRRQSVREVLELGTAAQSVLDASACCGTVHVSREGSVATLHTNVRLKVLYQDEGGAVLAAERSCDVACQMELPTNAKLRAKACCPEPLQTAVTDRGIEVRFGLELCVEAAERVRQVCIQSVKLQEDAPKDLSGQPSLVLRCLGKEESLWDLAKSHHTTICAILSANELEEEREVSHEKLLLIPRKRA